MFSIYFGCENEKKDPLSSEPVVTTSKYIVFLNDTCSYNYIDNYFNQLDSVSITRMLLGYNIIANINYGNIEYWFEKLNTDNETVFSIAGNTENVTICYTGKISADSAISYINNLDNIEFSSIDYYEKYIWIRVWGKSVIEQIQSLDFVIYIEFLI
jgi:hypothetical protein